MSSEKLYSSNTKCMCSFAVSNARMSSTLPSLQSKKTLDNFSSNDGHKIWLHYEHSILVHIAEHSLLVMRKKCILRYDPSQLDSGVIVSALAPLKYSAARSVAFESSSSSSLSPPHGSF